MYKINMNNKLIRIITVFSILLLISGLTAITSLGNEIPPVPVNFYGNVALDGEWSAPGTVIKAYLGNESNPRAQYEVEFTGLYHLSIDGNRSDEDKTITFKINDEMADTAIWHTSLIPESHNLDLIIGDLPISPQPTSPYSKEDTNKDSSISKNIASPTATISETTTPTSTPTAASTTTELEKSDIEDTNDTKETTDKTPISGFNILFAVASLSIAMYLIKTKRA